MVSTDIIDNWLTLARDLTATYKYYHLDFIEFTQMLPVVPINLSEEIKMSIPTFKSIKKRQERSKIYSIPLDFWWMLSIK